MQSYQIDRSVQHEQCQKSTLTFIYLIKRNKIGGGRMRSYTGPEGNLGEFLSNLVTFGMKLLEKFDKMRREDRNL